MSAPSTVVIAETNKSVDVKDVAIGTIIIVCAGEQIPLDGKVAKGKASVDESSITGESMPVRKEPGSTVFSGTVIQSGFLKVGLRLIQLMSITFDYLNPNSLQRWSYRPGETLTNTVGFPGSGHSIDTAGNSIYISL